MEGGVKRREAFLEISIDNTVIGRLVVELFDYQAPQSCARFWDLCVGSGPISYKGSSLKRSIPGLIQGGDVEAFNEIAAGKYLSDDNINWRQIDERGLLCAAKSSSQFVITMGPFPRLNDKAAVFGRVIDGDDIIQQIANIETTEDEDTVVSIQISDCGAVTSTEAEENIPRGRLPSRDFTHLHDRSPSPSRGHTPSEDYRGRLYSQNHPVHAAKKKASLALPYRHRHEEAHSKRPRRTGSKTKPEDLHGRLFDRHESRENSESPASSTGHSLLSGERYRDERIPSRLSRLSRDRSRGRGWRMQRGLVHHRRSDSPDHGMRGRVHQPRESDKFRVRDQSPSRAPKFAKVGALHEVRNRRSFPNQYAELRKMKRVAKFD